MDDEGIVTFAIEAGEGSSREKRMKTSEAVLEMQEPDAQIVRDLRSLAMIDGTSSREIWDDK